MGPEEPNNFIPCYPLNPGGGCDPDWTHCDEDPYYNVEIVVTESTKEYDSICVMTTHEKTDCPIISTDTSVVSYIHVEIIQRDSDDDVILTLSSEIKPGYNCNYYNDVIHVGEEYEICNNALFSMKITITISSFYELTFMKNYRCSHTYEQGYYTDCENR
eukprot:UN34601